ncbi:MAG: hypothetical protein ACRCYU_12115 [Nocardioides sp.]
MAQHTTHKRTARGKAETIRRRAIREMKRAARPLTLDDFGGAVVA